MNKQTIDFEQLKDMEKLHKDLIRLGLKKRKYGLATPAEQKRVSIDDDAIMETRTIYLPKRR